MRRLWRWLCCRTGHHRETVRWFGGWSFSLFGETCCTPERLEYVCVDCGEFRGVYCRGLRRTPSRRYALRGKA